MSGFSGQNILGQWRHEEEDMAVVSTTNESFNGKKDVRVSLDRLNIGFRISEGSWVGRHSEIQSAHRLQINPWLEDTELSV